MLTSAEKKVLFRYLHKAIEDVGHHTMRQLYYPSKLSTAYPVEDNLTRDEEIALGKIPWDDDMRSALRKVLADAAATSLFHFLALLDGVAKPQADEDGEWHGVQLARATSENQADGEFLHDELFESYWDWRAVRPNVGWQLDEETDVETGDES